MTKLRGVKAKSGRSYASIENLAAGVRQQLRIERNSPLDALRLFERLSRCQVRLVSGRLVPLQNEIEELPPGVEGLTHFDADRGAISVVLAEDTYCGLEGGRPRAVFATCHEVGHAVLHVQELEALATVPHVAAGFARGAPTHKSYQDTEWQANAFAAALLMPAQGVLDLCRPLGTICPTTIVTRFGVSYEAASIRAHVVRRHFRR